MSTGKVLLGLLAGIAVGATFGILFAPDKGSTTRKRISEKSDDYAAGLGQKFNEFVETITNKFEEVKGDMTRAAENGTSKFEEALDDVTSPKT